MVNLIICLSNGEHYHADNVDTIRFVGNICFVDMKDKSFVSYLDDIDGVGLVYEEL